MLSQTSLLAYRSLKDLGARQQQVYDAIDGMGSASNEQVSDHLKLPIQSVTGRVNELARYGYVAVVGTTFNKSGHLAKLWAIANPQDKKIKELDCEA
jgi:DNA-binding MarR family transcriptional regulator